MEKSKGSAAEQASKSFTGNTGGGWLDRAKKNLAEAMAGKPKTSPKALVGPTGGKDR